MAPDEKACLDQVRELLAYLPSNNLGHPPVSPADDTDDLVAELAELVPDPSHQPYDVKQLLRAVLDGGELLRVPRPVGAQPCLRFWPHRWPSRRRSC